MKKEGGQRQFFASVTLYADSRGNARYLAYGVCALFLAATATASILHHVSFGYGDYDTAVVAQALSNAFGENSFYSSIREKVYFGDHVSPMLFAIAPLYWLLPSPITLLLLQCVAAAGIGVLLFELFRRRAGDELAALGTVAYCFSAPLAWGLMSGFHVDIFGALFLLLALYALRHKQFYLLLIWVILAVTVKETIPLGVFFIGLIAPFEKRKWFWLPVLCGFAVASLLFAMEGVLPFFNDNVQSGSQYYTQYGRTFADQWRHFAQNPISVVSYALGAEQRGYLLLLFAPTLGLALLGKSWIVALPFIALCLLASDVRLLSLQGHYEMVTIPLLYASALEGLTWIRSKFPRRRDIVFGVGWSFALFNVLIGIAFGPWSEALGIPTEVEQAQRQLRRKLVEKAAESPSHNVSGAATFGFLSHLSHHQEVYSLHNVFLGRREDGGFFSRPRNAEWMAVDWSDEFFRLNRRYTMGYRNMRSYLSVNRLAPELIAGEVAFFRRDAFAPPMVDIVPVAENRELLSFPKLASFGALDMHVVYEEAVSLDPGVVFEWETVWHVQQDISQILLVEWVATTDGETTLLDAYPLGYLLSDTSQWEVGRLYRVRISAFVPHAMAGEGTTLQMRLGYQEGNAMVWLDNADSQAWTPRLQWPTAGAY